MRGNTLRSINHGGQGGVGPAYSGLSSPTRKTGSGRGSGHHGELETRPNLIWERRNLRAASLRPMGAESVGPPVCGDDEGGEMGSQRSATGQEALLTARQLGRQGAPLPWLAGWPMSCCLSSRDVCEGRSGAFLGLPARSHGSSALCHGAPHQ